MDWFLAWDESFRSGMAGGTVLGVARMLLTIGQVAHRHSLQSRYGQLLISHGILTLLFAILGGAFAWAFSGRAGEFTTGIAGLILLRSFAGNLLPELREGKEPDA